MSRLEISLVALCCWVGSLPGSRGTKRHDPTWLGFPTMNLAVSVAVFCYELGKRPRPAEQPHDVPPRDLTLALEKHVRQLMQEVEFFQSKNPARICMELQALAGRAGLTTRESSLLLALIRHVQWRLGGRR